MSVVILKRREIFHRDHTVSANVNPDPALPNQELIANVWPPAMSGAGNFNNSLTSPGGSSTRELHLHPHDGWNKELGGTFDELRPGSWLAIGQQLNNIDDVNQGVYVAKNLINTIRWVKVISKPEIVNGTSLVVTVEGADFNFRQMDPSKPIQPNTTNPSSGGLIPTYAIYVRNVVNVYEKTIRLDTTQ